MKTLKEFYESIKPEKQISFYNNQNELILNKNNVCDCDEIVKQYGNSIKYSYDTYGEHIDIVLDM